MIDSVIVTIRTRDSRINVDMELPANMPVIKLRKLLRQALHERYQQYWFARDSISLTCNGLALDEEDTLEECGIWDGSLILIE